MICNNAEDGWGGMPTGWGQRGNYGKPSSLEMHDIRFHHGHWDGKSSCSYREKRADKDKEDLFSYLAGERGGEGHKEHGDRGGGGSHWHSSSSWWKPTHHSSSDKHKLTRREKGAKMPLDKAEDVGPGKVSVLSSSDFKTKMGELKEADKIFAASDIHDADITKLDPTGHGTVILAGDFTKDGATSASRRIGMEDAIKGGAEWLEKIFFPQCEKNKDRKFVIIAGNHDHFLGDESADNIKWPENVAYLKDSEAEINGMRVYGSPWCEMRKGAAALNNPSSVAQRPFEITEDEAKAKYDQIPSGLDVLVVHQTPKADGYDGDWSMGGHCGSEALADAIRRAKPKLVICGHLHDGDHRPFKIGDSVVVNAAYVGWRDDPSYTAHEIGIERGGDGAAGVGFILDGEDTHQDNKSSSWKTEHEESKRQEADGPKTRSGSDESKSEEAQEPAIEEDVPLPDEGGNNDLVDEFLAYLANN